MGTVKTTSPTINRHRCFPFNQPWNISLCQSSKGNNFLWWASKIPLGDSSSCESQAYKFCSVCEYLRLVWVFVFNGWSLSCWSKQIEIWDRGTQWVVEVATNGKYECVTAATILFFFSSFPCNQQEEGKGGKHSLGSVSQFTHALWLFFFAGWWKNRQVNP